MKYCEDSFKKFRKLLNESIKLRKNDLDLQFLEKCKIYNIIPKFLWFVLSKKCLQTSKFYKSRQNKLLMNEIRCKRKSIDALKIHKMEAEDTLLGELTSFDRFFVEKHTSSVVSKFDVETTKIHSRKMANLSLNNNLEPSNLNGTVFNFSSITLSSKLKFIPAIGLDFCLPVYKINYVRNFFGFEKLASQRQVWNNCMVQVKILYFLANFCSMSFVIFQLNCNLLTVFHKLYRLFIQ